MKVLLIGGGGREHALAFKLRQSPLCEKLWCAPGNAGIAALAECLDIKAEDVKGIAAFCEQNRPDLVVVGPEAPLTLGLADVISAMGIPVFGPSAKAALLEGSKGFMKDLADKAKVPTAWYGRFNNSDAARQFAQTKGAPLVVKADGLAAGKGVILCQTLDEALAAIDEIMVSKNFGDAGNEVVIEEFLEGEEASFFALCDGNVAIPLIAVQDHKAVGDGDTGPNTGGMGAYSPVAAITQELAQEIMAKIITPSLKEMQECGRPFKGVLFAGIMLTPEGPKLLEFNVRFGDPECQVLMLRMKSDLLPLLLKAAKGELAGCEIEWRDEAALVVVMAAKGYPGDYHKGGEIRGLKKILQIPDLQVFHAGTKSSGDKILANGGRVLGITALGKDVEAAQANAYKGVDMLDWSEGFCRRDIGWRALKK